MLKYFLQTFFIFILISQHNAVAGTTCKLSGTVKDAQNGDAIPDVNVKISADFTTKIDVDLSSESIELETMEEAFKYYEDYNGSNKTFQATVLSGEGGYYEYKKDYEKSADLYLNASRAAKENVLNPEYMLKAAVNYIDAGKKDDAKDLLETIRKDYQTSTAFREVDKYLTLVN